MQERSVEITKCLLYILLSEIFLITLYRNTKKLSFNVLNHWYIWKFISCSHFKKMTHTHAAVYQKPLRFFFPHTPLTGTYDHFHFT